MKHDWRHLACVAILGGLAACSKPDQGVASSPGVPDPTKAPAPAAAAAPGVFAKAGVTIDQAPSLAADATTSGEIASTAQNDFYRFEVAAKVRDVAVVRLQNRSTSLRPYMKFYDANRSQLVENFDGTPGASVERRMTIEPGSTFYVQVLAYNSTGKYSLSVLPQHAYDAHEPNDDALSATPGKMAIANEGSILDDKDPDWFRISGAETKTVHVTLDNLSSTLRPYVKVFSATKSQVTEKYDSTPGANLDFTVDIEPGKDFYLEVQPYNSTGKYRLTAAAK
jgi:hypothetical protein